MPLYPCQLNLSRNMLSTPSAHDFLKNHTLFGYTKKIFVKFSSWIAITKNCYRIISAWNFCECMVQSSECWHLYTEKECPNHGQPQTELPVLAMGMSGHRPVLLRSFYSRKNLLSFIKTDLRSAYPPFFTTNWS